MEKRSAFTPKQTELRADIGDMPEAQDCGADILPLLEQVWQDDSVR
jgi:hypothetical protein